MLHHLRCRKKRSGQENCLLHIPTIHTLGFFFLLFFFLSLINTPIGSTSWPIRLVIPPRLSRPITNMDSNDVKPDYPLTNKRQVELTHSHDLAFHADTLFLFRTTNARTGDGAGSVPEFIQKLFRYNVGFRVWLQEKRGTIRGYKAVDGWQLIFVVNNGWFIVFRCMDLMVLFITECLRIRRFEIRFVGDLMARLSLSRIPMNSQKQFYPNTLSTVTLQALFDN